MDLKIFNVIPPWDWPETTRQTFIETLQDRSQPLSDRLIAADLGGDLVVMNEEMAEVLLAVVRSVDEPEDLRAKAAISLGPVLDQADIEGFADDGISDPPISEELFHEIQDALHKIYLDRSTPKLLRRRVLEASVRTTEDWHGDAIRAALQSDDEDWKLTAAFAMRFVAGFDKEIVEMLASPNPKIHYEAVQAAGSHEVDAAWPHITALLASRKTEKNLLLAAIEAAANIRPREAGPLLVDLSDSKDEEIAEAALDAMQMAEIQGDDPLEDDED